MRLPSDGNDAILVGQTYLISIYNTDIVLTCGDSCIYGQTYDGADQSQLWKCIEDEERGILFFNERRNKYLGRGHHSSLRLTCFENLRGDWNNPKFTSSPEELGQGYSITADIGEMGLQCFTHVQMSSSPSLNLSYYVHAFGLHMYIHSNTPFIRFQWVTGSHGQWLARSSAPNYHESAGVDGDHDQTQNMDDSAIQFLVANRITNIISLNRYPLDDEELQRLNSHNILYTHLPVKGNASAPTLDQLSKAQEAYVKNSSGRTLVYCGCGRGRTGTVITALQLFDGRDQTYTDYASNLVGGFGGPQRAALEELKVRLKDSYSDSDADL